MMSALLPALALNRRITGAQSLEKPWEPPHPTNAETEAQNREHYVHHVSRLSPTGTDAVSLNWSLWILPTWQEQVSQQGLKCKVAREQPLR